MGSLSFLSLPFLIAGAACALGPVLIHLLNRRRHRTIHWAAMDFLRKAVQKKRRVLNLRDWLLLAIRTLAVFLFGAALARPFFAREGQAISVRQPVHAIVIVDNSLSMGYETLDGSLLDLAKRKTRELIEGLPRGSRMTIVPACGSRDFINLDAVASREEALDALAKIEIADRSANIARVRELARQAAEAAPEFAKQILFLSDQQKLTWENATAEDGLTGLPPIQCLAVRPAEWENTWVSDLRVQDGLADMETPATVIVEIAHQGPSPRRDLQVTLLSGETTLGQQTITVEPGGARREVSFECVLGGIGPAPAAGQVAFLPLTAKITADRLPADDERSLSVPIVAALPVVFIDEVADEDEDVVRNRLGETRHLR
ncbi:MAG TPA: BatA domain-containing protein, partial [Pirellulaceae bacterium]